MKLNSTTAFFNNIYNFCFPKSSRLILCIGLIFAIINSAQSATVTGFYFENESYFLNSGDTVSLRPIFEPANTKSKITYTSTNENISRIVFLNEDGSVVISALFEGTATITGRTEEGNFEAITIISVSGVTSDEFPVTSISLNPDGALLQSGDTLTLSVNVFPLNATMKNVLFKTSNFGVASIVENISPTSVLIGALFPGIATITAVSMDGGFETYTVITVTGETPPVIVPVTGIELTPKKVSLVSGDTVYFTARTLPANATMKNIYFSTSDQNIARVALTPSVNSAVVSSLFPGTVTITATTMHAGKKASMVLKVTAFPYDLNPFDFSHFPDSVRRYAKVMTNSSNSLVLTWPSMKGGSYYCIQYSLSASFSNPSFTVCGINETNFEIDGLTLGSNIRASKKDTLYWKVAIVDQSGKMYWSELNKYAGSNTTTALTNEIKKDLGIFPNPAQDKLYIKGITDGVEISIFQLSSNAVLEGRTPMVDISSLPVGLYFARIATNYFRFIKE